jgi:hypothetical protein
MSHTVSGPTAITSVAGDPVSAASAVTWSSAAAGRAVATTATAARVSSGASSRSSANVSASAQWTSSNTSTTESSCCRDEPVSDITEHREPVPPRIDRCGRDVILARDDARRRS